LSPTVKISFSLTPSAPRYSSAILGRRAILGNRADAYPNVRADLGPTAPAANFRKGPLAPLSRKCDRIAKPPEYRAEGPGFVRVVRIRPTVRPQATIVPRRTRQLSANPT